MAYAKDLIGLKFGRLQVVSRDYDKQNEYLKEKGEHRAFWNCICDCGNTCVVASSALKNKTSPTMSCGCYKKEKTMNRRTQKILNG